MVFMNIHHRSCGVAGGFKRIRKIWLDINELQSQDGTGSYVRGIEAVEFQEQCEVFREPIGTWMSLDFTSYWTKPDVFTQAVLALKHCVQGGNLLQPL